MLSRAVLYFQQRQFHVCKLLDRSVFAVKGPDNVKFLQGLLTNDIDLLTTQKPILYSLMLNVQVLIFL